MNDFSDIFDALAPETMQDFEIVEYIGDKKLEDMYFVNQPVTQSQATKFKAWFVEADIGVKKGAAGIADFDVPTIRIQTKIYPQALTLSDGDKVLHVQSGTRYSIRLMRDTSRFTNTIRFALVEDI